MSTATAEQLVPPSVWEMEVAESNGEGGFVPCPPGNFPARVAGLFDVGLQADTKKDQKTGEVTNVQVRKLVLVFELTKKQPDGKPFVMGDRYTWSMRDNSNFYKLVCNVVGSRFTPGQKFNPTTLLGRLVMVNVTNSAPNDKGKVYANVGGVSQFPEGFPEPSFRYEPLSWSAAEGKPFPPLTWLPYVYGKTIAELAGHPSAAPAKAQAPAPTLSSSTQAPSHVAAMLGRYGLEWPYSNDDLDAKRQTIPPGDFAVLETHAIPF